MVMLTPSSSLIYCDIYCIVISWKTNLLGTYTWWYKKQPYFQTLQQESLIVALSKYAIRIGIEKYLKTLTTLS